MNKRLFCALCWMSSVGYSTVMCVSDLLRVLPEKDLLGASKEDIYRLSEEPIKRALERSSDFSKVKDLCAIIDALEGGCHFSAQWKQHRDVMSGFFSELKTLYECKLEIKLPGQWSGIVERNLEQINDDIASLEQKVKSHLTNLDSFHLSHEYKQYLCVLRAIIDRCGFQVPAEQDS